MDQCFILHPSYVAQVAFNMIKPSFNPVVQEKIHLLQEYQFDQIQTYVDKS